MKKKFISLLVAFCLILGILPTAAFAADQTSADAGVRIHYVQDSYDESTGIFKVNVQAKLPNGTGITAMGAILSYDNTKLTLINQNNSNEIAGTDGELKNPNAAAIKVLLAIEDEYGSKSEYSIANGDLYKSGDRSALYAYLYTQDAANAEKSSDNWIDCFQVSFKSSTSNPEEELDNDSLRIADAAKDDELIKAIFPANNIYTVYITDNSNPAKIYCFNKMSGNTSGEASGELYIMAAEGTGTAIYPGSTNSPSQGEGGEPIDPPAGNTGYEIYYELDKSDDTDSDQYHEYGVDDTVSATVYIKNNTGKAVILQAYDLYLTYDSNVLTCGDFDPEYDNKGAKVEDANGVARIQAIGSTEATADINISLPEDGSAVKLGTIEFTISDATVYDIPMNIALIPGSKEQGETSTNIAVADVVDDTDTGNKNSHYPTITGNVKGAEVNTKHTITWMNEDSTLKTEEVGHNLTPSYDGDTPSKAATAQYTYTFAGWTPAIAKATTDATYTATYTTTTNGYTVTWKNWDDTVLETDEGVVYGTTPTYDGDTPTKAEDEKYTYLFKGWEPEIAAVTGNAEYKATYTPEAKKFTITLDLNGGTLAGDARTSIEYTADDQVTLPTASRAGKNFGGWQVKNAAGNWSTETKYSGTVSNMYGTVELQAVWTDKDYTVSVDENITNGTVAAENNDGASGATANNGETINVTVKPNPGYKIDKVSYYETGDENKALTEIELTNDAYSFQMPDCSVTVTATFVKDDLSITVEKDIADGSVAIDPETKTTAQTGETVELTNTPAEGYELKEYKVTYNDGTGEKTVTVTVDPETGNGSFTMPAYPVTVTAEFKAKALEITIDSTIQHVTVEAQMNSTKVDTAKLGDTVTLVDKPDTGYKLVENSWTVTETNGTRTVEVTNGTFTMPAYPVTISAQYEAITYTITYMDGETGISGLNPATYTIESTVTLPTYSKNNYEFMGWKVTDGANDKWVENSEFKADETTLTGYYGNVTLTAVWDEAITYKVENYKYAKTGYVMLRIATNSNSDAYTFEGEPMYYTTDSNYLVSGSDATGVFYTLISVDYVSDEGKLTETGMAKLVAGSEAAKTIDYNGDINGDGVKNIADANIVYQMIVNGGGYYTDLSAENRTDTESRLMADMNKESYDSSVARATIADVNAIMNIINGTSN